MRDIRRLLKTYVTRLETKDAAARATKEWRIVARVLDRLFFFCYIGTILVSLFTIFPGDVSHWYSTEPPTDAPPTGAPPTDAPPTDAPSTDTPPASSEDTQVVEDYEYMR